MIRNRTGPSAHSLWCSRSHLQECLCIWSYRWWNWWWYKIMVKFAAERDGWKKQRLERYARWETSAAPSCKNVCDISFRLAGQLRVGVLWFSRTPEMWRLKLCIDLNSTFVSDCVEDGLVQLFRVLGHRNITVVQSMPRILRSLRLLEHFCVNCTGVSATMKFRIFLISWFIFVNVYRFVVVVDNTLNKYLQALCCIIRKWNYVADTAFLYLKLGGILESLCPSVCPGFVRKTFSEPFNHVQLNLVWWWIIMSQSVGDHRCCLQEQGHSEG